MTISPELWEYFTFLSPIICFIVALAYLCKGKSSKRSYNVDRFSTVDEVTDALREAGLESSGLIFGIDYTMSNTWQGKRSFNGSCLHSISPNKANPYQQVIGILGETLSSFDDDGLIPAMGFGDLNTKDYSVFPLIPGGLCAGFHGVLEAYNHVTPNIVLNGPTNFAPIIRQAIQIVRDRRQFHILVIIADGQVTSERETKEAIVEASHYPLSIVTIGVGDGPWTTMEKFDDNIRGRLFDNFQFVDYVKVTGCAKNREAAFALHALMEVPDQYKAIIKLGLLNFDKR